jgi:hypothetical protein
MFFLSGNTILTKYCAASTPNKRIKIETMGLSFIPPSQWIAKQDPQSGNYIMGSNTIPGLLLVLPHNYSSLQELINNSSQGFVDEGVSMYPSGNVKTLSKNAAGAEFTGSFNGAQAKAYVTGVVSPNGGGLLAICVTETAKYSAQHKKSAVEFAESVKFSKLKGTADSRWMAGQYYSYQGSTERKLTLCPSGIYYYNSEASYSGNFTDGGGNNTGAWGTANENRGDGRWSIIGNRQQGTIIFITSDGSREEQHYKVGNGCIYINGVTMGYNGTANCN